VAQSKLIELAKVVRSKNAGPFELTFDVMFDDDATYVAGAREAGLSAYRVGGVDGVHAGLAAHGLGVV